NDFFAPLVFLTEPDQFTLALGLNSFQSAHGGTQLNLMMAAATLVCIPVALLYFFTQRYFVQGIAMTGMKT
ncbi:MAG: carbohydrate ABC transporter permease, partial [Planctomycetota bacterium]